VQGQAAEETVKTFAPRWCAAAAFSFGRLTALSSLRCDDLCCIPV
jgi:hypothetical protein